MNYENIILRGHGPITVVTINRPSVLNALNRQTLEELKHALEVLQSDATSRVLILTGAGEKSFVAGADISEMQGMSPKQAREWSAFGHLVCDGLGKLDIPVIAAVNGFALGGGLELALACDFIYASSNAKFGLVETKLGLIPGFGGVARLSRRVTKAYALEMMYSASVIDADEALRIGLVNKKVTGSVLESAMETAQRILQQGPVAISQVKRLVREGGDLSIEEANKMEQGSFGQIFSTKDHAEGIRAFLEKRPALFDGN